jgi:2,3-diketo-5-methylthio-1-phosphopentane phosphatase
MSAETLVLDFDGTVACLDVGDELCDRFADPRWRELDRRWDRREIALPDAQLEMWALIDASPEEIAAYVREHGALRDGFDALLDAARARGAELVLASGGFDFYIEAILGERLRRFDRVLANHGVLAGRGVTVSFPHRAALGCALCAVCKGRVVDEARRAGRRVVFAGDGSTDRCAIGRADRLFAVRGSKLAAACRAAGAPFEEFDSFHEVVAALDDAPTGRPPAAS